MTTNGHDAWQKFTCLACGYVYDEKLGDPKSGLATGTRFVDISNDWQCPLCGTTKSGFKADDAHLNDHSLTAFAYHNNQRGIVIIGGGLAGWSVVDAVRALDKQIPITLICGDRGDRYHKPMLSVALSQGKTASDLVRTTAVQSATDNQVRLLANTFVTHIDTNTQTLQTTCGNIGYDDLVLAIGAIPAYPPTIAQDMAWHINNLEKFLALQTHLSTGKQPKNLAIIGAGMVGIELAEDLIHAGHQVSLIDVGAYPLSTLLPAIAGERILSAIKNKGIGWLGKSMVNGMVPSHAGHDITLIDLTNNNEQTLHFDEVIVATGLMVDAELPTHAGVDFNKRTGIAVHRSTLQTSVPHIYALGDCISIDGMPCRYVAPHRTQAAAIAHEILGLTHCGYEHKTPMIRLKNKSITVTANGNPTADGDWRVIKNETDELSLELHDGGNIIAKVLLKSPQ